MPAFEDEITDRAEVEEEKTDSDASEEEHKHKRTILEFIIDANEEDEDFWEEEFYESIVRIKKRHPAEGL